MLRLAVLAVLALLAGVCAGAGETKKQKAETLSRGWGNGISWAHSYDQALSLMVKSHKPLMVILHMDTCPYSQALKKAFVADKSIQKMAKEDFIMVNLVSETIDKNLAPDGYYVPRIMFVDPSLTVRADIFGKYESHHYTYDADDLQLLAQNMKKAKVLLRTEL